jgi:hypothetical protein
MKLLDPNMNLIEAPQSEDEYTVNEVNSHNQLFAINFVNTFLFKLSLFQEKFIFNYSEFMNFFDYQCVISNLLWFICIKD